MRLFIALPLSDQARRAVKKIVKKLERGHWAVSWEPEEKWHLTIDFLGEVEKLEPVIKKVESACQNTEPFELKFKGLGAFPDLLLPRTVWLGLKGDLKSFYKLTKSITDKTVHPHITLGRIKPEMGRRQRLELGKIITKNRILDIPQTWLVDRVCVYESKLTDRGSTYQVKFSQRFEKQNQKD
jgi:2'-5' RNA ligase